MASHPAWFCFFWRLLLGFLRQPNLRGLCTQLKMVVVNEAKSSDSYGTLGICMAVPVLEKMSTADRDAGYYSLNPAAVAGDIFPLSGNDRNSPAMPPEIHEYFDNAKIALLQSPQHGKFNQLDSNYYPDAGFVGNDKIVFLVDNGVHKVEVVYFIHVASIADMSEIHRKYCKIEAWKVSYFDSILLPNVDVSSYWSESGRSKITAG